MKKPAPAAEGCCSPERGALAKAIADHAQVGVVRAAAARADAPIYAAQRGVYAAQAALAHAHAVAGEQAAEVLVAGRAGPTTGPSVREARGALVAAEDALATAVAARDSLKQQVRELEMRFTGEKLQRAAAQVVAAEARGLAEALAGEVAQLQSQLLERGRQLAWLARRTLPLIEQPGPSYGEVIDDSIRRTLWRMEQAPAHWDQNPSVWTGPTIAGAAPWEAWLEALLRDASAPMPEKP